ncbi:MAG TPA: GIY-YIG nuclease family protein [Ignavibacteriaceae bacterium]|nr:GIY-YIG nuclease family protein [Ignavibacteriaceae bacterium]
MYIFLQIDQKHYNIGITNNLARKISEHKNKLLDGITKRYSLDKLVYFEVFNNLNYAIRRKKQLKTDPDSGKLI